MKATALLVVAALPAQADEAADFARCAALWDGAASVWADYPGLGIAPDEARALATEFAQGALARGMAPNILQAIRSERAAGNALTVRGTVAGDRQSSKLFQRLSTDCDALLETQEDR